MSVSQTVSVSESVSVSVVSIGLRLSLSFPLVQPSDVLGRVSAGVELADSISGSEVSQTVDVVKTKTNSVSVVRVSFSAPLSDVVSVDSMKTLRRPGYKRSGVSSMVSNAVSVSVEGSSVSVSVVRISLGTPLTNVVSTASVAGGLDSITKGSRPGGSKASVVSVSISLSRGQGGNSQAGGNQELVHDDTTHWSTEL